ncbi:MULTISPECIES: oligoendopeptidase F [Globicatella]|uniref:Oligopeptidase F n=1 Tax=Globicatella sulfidifaciens TaxID=136093 RepID=A0A7X8C5K6_9LACT|nr:MULTISPECIES: oligoendopeptidase F [Globicatella]NLJ19095.1 oligoendopeptidase F [Globicatella sulfidifaciens]WPC07844.1 oligoendopeptidase F [Globicatella sp. PHS-GS-PNBC-21-1553]
MINRETAPIEQTWDLTTLFQDEKSYEEALDKLVVDTENFTKQYRGQIQTATDINAAFAHYRSILELRARILPYASLPVNANTLDKEAQNRYSHASRVLANVSAQLSFFENEVANIADAILKEAATNTEDQLAITKIIKQKPHQLSPETEATLAALSNTLDYPYQGYNDIKFKDLQFPDFEVNGQVHEMTYNSFEGRQEATPDTDLRRAAFRNFSDTLRRYQHSTASVYNAQVQMEKTMATLRGYDSVIDYLLERQDVSVDLYNRQIDVIMDELAPHMRRYAQLIGEIYQLDEVRYEDLKLDIDPTFSPNVTYQEAQQYVLDGLAQLGEDYIAIMREAFDNRWIDYAETRGKRTGAFCSSPYGTNSFILMFFSENMSDTMTLAHELGHAGHFQMAYRYQNILNARPSMYFVEAPSTANELLVENHLLDVAGDDVRMKRWIISQMVGKTYYHNFVTHLLEAYYQREVYRLVDQGKSVDAETLNRIYRETLEKFWGDSVVLTEGAELTWMRQPHYYMGLYSYSYSAGLTIGTQVANNIRQQGAAAAEQWIKVLQMGGSKSPLELAKAADVDVSTDQPLKSTIAYIGRLIDQLENYTKELNK